MTREPALASLLSTHLLLEVKMLGVHANTLTKLGHPGSTA
jgi:hypothetical protein